MKMLLPLALVLAAFLGGASTVTAGPALMRFVNDRIVEFDFTGMDGFGGDAAIKVTTARPEDSSGVWLSLCGASDRSAAWSFGKDGTNPAEASLSFSDVAQQGLGGCSTVPSQNARVTFSEDTTVVRGRASGVGIGGEPGTGTTLTNASVCIADACVTRAGGGTVGVSNLQAANGIGIGVASPGLPALSFLEGAAPLGAVNEARIYARDNGSGKTELVVVFGSGSVVIAVEP